jgi:hypothetical protein
VATGCDLQEPFKHDFQYSIKLTKAEIKTIGEAYNCRNCNPLERFVV